MKILVVDDDEVTCSLLREVLERDGWWVAVASSGEDALRQMEREAFPVVLSDIRMLEMDGVTLLRRIKKTKAQSQLQTEVVLMTGFGSMDGAIEAVREGAFDYISKPFGMDQLKSVVTRAFAQSGARLSDSVRPAIQQKALTGRSAAMIEVYKTLARSALSSCSVLIMGESGTGKELAARAIHDHGPRKARRFVAVNCGALTESLLETELFGHVRGAFTGAVGEKRGLFEEAHEGTLFLDEVGDLSPGLQVRLLRVLQEGELRPVGGLESRRVDVRIVAATHRDLEARVREGCFREDLYYRLKVISIELPPLRQRMADLPELIDLFLAKYSEKSRKRVSHVSDEAMAVLRSYEWPGNIRELEHAVEHAVAMTRTTVLFPEDFPQEVLRSRHDAPQKASLSRLEDVERDHIAKVLREVNYNKSKASELLGIDRATLYRKALRHGIDLRARN